jgi:hypothetical protein
MSYQVLKKGYSHERNITEQQPGVLTYSLQRVLARPGELLDSAATTTQLLLLFTHTSFISAEAQFLQFPEPLIEDQGHTSIKRLV